MTRLAILITALEEQHFTSISSERRMLVVRKDVPLVK